MKHDPASVSERDQRRLRKEFKRRRDELPPIERMAAYKSKLEGIYAQGPNVVRKSVCTPIPTTSTHTVTQADTETFSHTHTRTHRHTPSLPSTGTEGQGRLDGRARRKGQEAAYTDPRF
jgi:hypothetical protein